MVERKCIICGRSFPCYPSDNKVTCSKDCSRERKRRLVKSGPVKWGMEARKRASLKGKTGNLALGTAAAQRSPISGRFETNKEAKIWVLVSPSGEEIIVRNLLLWARNNSELFDKPPGDKSAVQIANGFKAIAQTMKGNRGVPGKQRGAMSYFGWTLKEIPKSQDSHTEKQNKTMSHRRNGEKGSPP